MGDSQLLNELEESILELDLLDHEMKSTPSNIRTVHASREERKPKTESFSIIDIKRRSMEYMKVRKRWRKEREREAQMTEEYLSENIDGTEEMRGINVLFGPRRPNKKPRKRIVYKTINSIQEKRTPLPKEEIPPNIENPVIPTSKQMKIETM